MKRVRNVALAFAAMLFLCGSIHALAQADPPSRVARLNLMEGSISYLPSGGGQNDWTAATLNRPLTIGARLWADQNSRAELHIGSTYADRAGAALWKHAAVSVHKNGNGTPLRQRCSNRYLMRSTLTDLGEQLVNAFYQITI